MMKNTERMLKQNREKLENKLGSRKFLSYRLLNLMVI